MSASRESQNWTGYGAPVGEVAESGLTRLALQTPFRALDELRENGLEAIGAIVWLLVVSLWLVFPPLWLVNAVQRRGEARAWVAKTERHR